MIVDLAEKARDEMVQNNLPRSRDHVLAILCADSHYETIGGGSKHLQNLNNKKVGTPFTQISEDMSENNAFPINKSINESKI